MIKTITLPASEPVTLDQVKLHCRVDADLLDDDPLLLMLISAAREQCEHLLGNALLPQTLETDFSRRDGAWAATLPPGAQIVAVHAGDPAAPITTGWVRDGSRVHAFDELLVGIDPASLRVRYQAGMFAVPEGVPAAIRHWIQLRVATAYENREALGDGRAMTEQPRQFVDGLLDPYRSYV